MTLIDAIKKCRESALTDWELVEFAQRLVSRNMKYSLENSLDAPQAAFEKGQGYCWHQAHVLNVLLHQLGFDSRLVHSFKNLFPEVELDGVIVKDFVSGHVWCRVKINDVEKDVCPGNSENKPGIIHFKPLEKVQEWNGVIDFLTYYGGAFYNWRRRKIREDKNKAGK